MSKTRLIHKGNVARMIAKTKLHKRTREDSAERLVIAEKPTKLAAVTPPPATPKPQVIRAKSEWGDERKENRRGRDIAAARAEARREAAPPPPVKAIFA